MPDVGAPVGDTGVAMQVRPKTTSWRWAWLALAAGLALRALQLRRRARRLGTLPPAPLDAALLDDAGREWCWTIADAVVVEAETRTRAVRYARDEGLDVVDLVPADLPAEHALRVLRDADPATYRTARFARGTSALQAVVARRGVAERTGLATAAGANPVRFDRLAVALKRCSPTGADLVVDPSTHAVPADPDQARAYLTVRFGPMGTAALGGPLVGFAVLAVGLVVAPAAGLAAIGAWCAQPLVALLGTPLAPEDLWRRSALRWALGPRDALRTLRGSWRPTPDDTGLPDPEERRTHYAAVLACGTDRFFEDARDDCPICGSTDLGTHLETTDLVQRKPGHFRLDRCGACGHVFQNPRLSVEGLAFYYEDLYEGLGAEEVEYLFASNWVYPPRARLVEGLAEPQRWLDLGTGFGHFCLAAREIWPDTVFDGLDIGASVEEAARRGWIDTAHHGHFVDLAGGLGGAYDVVSMFHYLEHTRDPLAELDAAASVLAPGGHLLVELPDPDSPYHRLTGRFWMPWLQPQHQHLFSEAALCTELERRGFEVVRSGPLEEWFPAMGLTASLWLLLNHLAPRTDEPWHFDVGPLDRARRLAVFGALAPPLTVLAATLDQLAVLAVPSLRGADAFRVVARRPAERAAAGPAGLGP